MKNQVTLTVSLVLVGLSFQTSKCLGQQEFKAYLVQGTMYLNEDFTKRNFSKILVITDIHDMEVNKQIMQEFSDIGVNAVNSVDIIPPVRKYSDEELITICRKHNIDGIIAAEIQDKVGVNGSMAVYLRLSLRDLQTSTNTVTFIGHAVSETAAPDKAVHRFFKAVAKELQPVIAL